MCAMQETQVRSLGWEDPLEKGTATHSSILVWRIPWTIQSMGLQRIEHDSATFKKKTVEFTECLIPMPIRICLLYQLGCIWLQLTETQLTMT